MYRIQNKLLVQLLNTYESYLISFLLQEKIITKSQATYIIFKKPLYPNINIFAFLLKEKIITDKHLPTIIKKTIKIEVFLSHSYIRDIHVMNLQLLDIYSKKYLTIKAKYYLSEINKDFSAKNINFKRVIVKFMIFFIIPIILSKELFCITQNILYLLQLGFKIYILIFGYQNKKNISFINNNFQYYPIYSVLLPMYREIGNISGIIKMIQSIDYPKNRLEVKLIIEEDDILMNKAIYLYELADYIQVIKVPFSLPRTKPKALNYAMNYCIGEYLVVYDAEDLPDSNQLKIALNTFHQLPKTIGCLQAKLHLYNYHENLLTLLFSIEYSLWFDFLLDGLSNKNLPIPLGGSSNHFRVKVLKDVGLWDPYNVTEDADLGLRLYVHGYFSKILDSKTLEEAPINLYAWLTQRTRWIKGFIQTFIVFFKCNHKIPFFSKFAIWNFIGLSTYSFFIMPLLIIINIFWVINYQIKIFLLSTMSISLIYILCAGLIAFNKLHGKKIYLLIVIFVWPFYFLLHSVAVYIAIVELLISPFKWNKTKHNVTKVIYTSEDIF